MDLIYLRYYQLMGENDYIIMVDYSSCIVQEEALYRAQNQLSNEGFILTKIEFPYIHCYKFKENKDKSE